MLRSSIFAAALILGCAALPHQASAQTTQAQVSATCKDGTSFTGTSHKGACKGHGGVATWGSAPSGSMAPAPAANSMSSSSTPMSATSKPSTSTMSMAPGGGAGQVWVNTSSKVYHCPGDRYYGKTKQGQYMTESAAIAAGDKPDHGKSCK